MKKQSLRSGILALPPGKVFEIGDFRDYEKSYVIPVLSKMVKEGLIQRLTRGMYAIPNPVELPIVKKVVNIGANPEDIWDRTISSKGIIVGTSLFNRLRFTTQNPAVRVVLTDKRKRGTKQVGATYLKYIESKVPVNKKNTPFLEILETAKNYNKIADSNPQDVLKFLKDRIDGMPEEDKSRLVKLSLSYRPSVRYVLFRLGLGNKKILSLNPKSRFKYAQ